MFACTALVEHFMHLFSQQFLACLRVSGEQAFCSHSADKLQVIAMRGRYREEVPFFAHLEAQKKSTVWLKLLEGIMKNTVASILQACVQTRLEDGRERFHLTATTGVLLDPRSSGF